MASVRMLALVACLLVGAQGVRVQLEVEGRSNPIRKVVTMLQGLKTKVTAEGERDAALFDKFMCYCKTGGASLQKSIDAADNKIPQVGSALKEAQEKEAQAKADLANAQTARSDAKSAVAEATSLREKEASAYAKVSSDFEANIAAMGKAIAALEKGAAGAFLQTQAASTLRKLSLTVDMSSTARDVLSSFLAEGAGYAPASGEITGILKQMKDTMEADLAQATKEEDAAKASFAELAAAKAKEIAANTDTIEAKMTQIGELAVDIVQMKEDIDDTTKALGEDKKFLADMEKNCATKQDEYDVVKKTRAEEMLAISETIKILNDDDALELFKKTLPGASFLQAKVTNKQMKQQALNALKGGKGDFRLDLISLALKGQKVSFDKVIVMIDEMVALLKKEQGDDDNKREYCEKALDAGEDKHKELNQKVQDLANTIDDTEGKIANLSEEIAALGQGIRDLDKAVGEATENRKTEHAENTDTLASNNAAKDILGFAKNRLNKFYNPALYKAPAKKELSKEDRIVASMGFIQGAGAPPPPPQAVAAYKKKGEESTGVIAMIDLLEADLVKEITEVETSEKEAQSEYDTFMEDSADKRRADSQSVEEKESSKAMAEGALQKAGEEHHATLNEAMATAQYIGELHKECDWLLMNFDARKAARTGEVESLTNAKAVLSGADFSLIQTAVKFLRGA